MRGPRFTIKNLLIKIIIISIGLAAISHPSLGWLVVVSSLFYTLYLTAIVGSLVQRGKKRAFWVGFTVFASGYLLLATFGAFPSFLLQASGNPINCFLEVGTAFIVGKNINVSEVISALNQVTEEHAMVLSMYLLGLVFADSGGRIGRYLGSEDTSERARDAQHPV